MTFRISTLKSFDYFPNAVNLGFSLAIKLFLSETLPVDDNRFRRTLQSHGLFKQVDHEFFKSFRVQQLLWLFDHAAVAVSECSICTNIPDHAQGMAHLTSHVFSDVLAGGNCSNDETVSLKTSATRVDLPKSFV